MRYLVANKSNLTKKAIQLLGSEYTLEREKMLKKANTLEEFNECMLGYGIEEEKSISGNNDFRYVNLGDAYLLTIVEYRGKLRICCWADIVEEYMNDFE